MTEEVQSKIEKLALKDIFLGSTQQRKEVYSHPENYKLLLKNMKSLLEEEQEFFIFYPAALSMIQDLITIQRFKEENYSLRSITNEVIVLSNELKGAPNSEEILRRYLKVQFFKRFGTHKVYRQREDRDSGILLLRNLLLELQTFDYELYSKISSFDSFSSISFSKRIKFVSSINYLSQYLPEIFTERFIIDAMNTLDQIIDDGHYKEYQKVARKNLEKLLSTRKN